MERRDQPGLYDRGIEPVAGGALAEVSPCIVCGGTRAHPIFRTEGVDAPTVACAVCGLARYHPMPGPEQIRSFYPDPYYGKPGRKFRPLFERAVRLVARRHIAFLCRRLPAGARVLDVGCGRGVLLGGLADRGLEVHGFDISEAAVCGADPRARIRVAPSLAAAGYPDGHFHEVVLWHVLEHVPDPLATLRECRRVVRSDGRLIVAVPNFSSLQARWSGPFWFHLDPPRHLYHFPVSALRRLLERCGFECVSEHHFSLRQNPFGWIQSAANRFSRGPRNALYSFLYPDGGGARGRRSGAALRSWSFLALGALPALALVALETLIRSGATVHIVARPARTATPPLAP